MLRNQVSNHLKICPASAVLCCYSQQGAASYNSGFERWIFAQKPHIHMAWNNGRQEGKIALDSVCCDRPLRRCDLERHLLFAHADHNMFVEPCPCHHTNKRTEKSNPSPGNYVEVTPASPLYPTPSMGKSYGRVPARRLPRLMKLNSSASGSDEDTSGSPPNRRGGGGRF